MSELGELIEQGETVNPVSRWAHGARTWRRVSYLTLPWLEQTGTGTPLS